MTSWTHSGSGNWDVPANWSAGVPIGSGTANINNSGTAVIDVSTNMAQSGVTNVGMSGTDGVLLISHGSLSSGMTNVGVGPSAPGTLLIDNNGVLNQSGTVSIGVQSGSGNMVITSGTVISIDLFVGGNVGSPGTGSMMINGGVFNLTNFPIGNTDGVGDVTMTSGTVVVSSNINVGGRAGPGTATLTVSSGQMSAAAVFYIGSGGLGTMTVNGGTLNLNSFYVGGNAFVSGTGSLTIDSGLVNANFVAFGSVGVCSGTLSLNGGILSTNSVAAFQPNETFIFNGGTLQAKSNNPNFISGFSSGNLITNGGIIDTNRFQIAASSEISGAGGLTIIGSGTLAYTANNTYTGDTTIASDTTLQLGNGGITGSIVSNVANNGTLVFNRSDLLTFTGTISGTGWVIQAGSGTTVFISNNTYTGTTTISSGALQIGNGGSIGSLGTGPIVDNSNLIFNFSTSTTVPVVITGSGTLTQAGTGATTLTGTNAYSGGTLINSGTLIGTTSSLHGAIDNSSDLVFSQSGSTGTFNGTISNTGNVTINSLGGKVNFNTDQTYTGSTIIQAGELSVNAQLASANVLINPNGILSGIGILAGNMLNSGLLSPGNNGFGTITIGGNYMQNSSGKLLIEIASPTRFDLVRVGGNASLNGTLQVVLLEGFVPSPSDTFIILITGGVVSGTFSLLDAPPGFTLEVFYDPSDVRLSLLAIPGMPVIPLLPSLEELASRMSANIKDIIFNITNTQYGQLTTRLVAIRSGVGAMTLQGLTQEPMAEQFSKRERYQDKQMVAHATETDLWDIFASSSGVFSRINNVCDLPKINSIAGLFSVGADYRINEYANVGIYTGYQGFKSWYSDGSLLRSNGVKFGLYGTAQWKGFYLDSIVGGGANFLDMRRAIDVKGYRWNARSHPFAGELDSLLGAGYEYRLGSWIFGANNSIQYTYLGISAFTESGKRNLNVRVDGQNPSSLVYTLGGNISYLWEIAPNYQILPTVGLSWQHEFLNYGQRIGTNFANRVGSPFYFYSPTAARNNAFGVAGITAQIASRFGTYIYYNPQFGGGQMISHGALVGVNFNF